MIAETHATTQLPWRCCACQEERSRGLQRGQLSIGQHCSRDLAYAVAVRQGGAMLDTEMSDDAQAFSSNGRPDNGSRVPVRMQMQVQRSFALFAARLHGAGLRGPDVGP